MSAIATMYDRKNIENICPTARPMSIDSVKSKEDTLACLYDNAMDISDVNDAGCVARLNHSELWRVLWVSLPS